MRDRQRRRVHTREYDLCQLADELGLTVTKVGRNYVTLAEHDSVRIDLRSNTFKQYSTGLYGDPVAFLMAFGEEHDKRFKAVDYCIRFLEKQLNIKPELKKKIDHVPREREPLVLPEKDDNNKQVFAYLNRSRGIAPEILNYFIDNGLVYQSKEYKNCVFTSYYEDGKPAFITERSASASYKFMKEHSGNDYNHCIYLNHNSDTIFVTESVIDMMSVMTLNHLNGKFKKWNYLSLNSVSKDNALYEHLKKDKNIKDVVILLDNDEAGKIAGDRICENIKKNFKEVKTLRIYPQNKDFNEDLQQVIAKKNKDMKKDHNQNNDLCICK